MDNEQEDLLQKTYDLTEQNNKILRGIRRSNRLASLWHVLYWAVIIIVSVVAYQYVEPYTTALIKDYQTLQTEVNSVKAITDKIPVSLK